MAGKQAKTLSTDHIDDLLFFAERSRHPLRNRLIVLLSVKAGLRAAEIAKLTWDMVLGPSSEVGSAIELQDKIAKKRGGRSIPLHVELREALIEARKLCNGQSHIIRSERGGELSPEVGDGGNRKGGISWGCLTPPLLHRRSDMPCPTITSSI
jgi:integrase